MKLDLLRVELENRIDLNPYLIKNLNAIRFLSIITHNYRIDRKEMHAHNFDFRPN